LHLRYRRGTLAFYEQPGDHVQSYPILLDVSGQYFLRPHPYRMVAGGQVESERRTQGVEALDENVSPSETASVNWFADRCVPGLGMMAPKRVHPVLYDTPADGLAALGPVAGVRGLLIGAGFGMSAFAVAPAVGQALAQMVVDGNTLQNLAPFSPMRPSLRNM
jgi:glycine/D-amino acid oxidase-like deaminating enzyme